MSRKLPKPPQDDKLPPPDIDKKVASSLNAKEVCMSSYLKEEQAKLSVLQKHVKVTELPTGRTIHGKKSAIVFLSSTVATERDLKSDM